MITELSKNGYLVLNSFMDYVYSKYPEKRLPENLVDEIIKGSINEHTINYYNITLLIGKAHDWFMACEDDIYFEKSIGDFLNIFLSG